MLNILEITKNHNPYTDKVKRNRTKQDDNMQRYYNIDRKYTQNNTYE